MNISLLESVQQFKYILQRFSVKNIWGIKNKECLFKKEGGGVFYLDPLGVFLLDDLI